MRTNFASKSCYAHKACFVRITEGTCAHDATKFMVRITEGTCAHNALKVRHGHKIYCAHNGGDLCGH